MDFYNELLKALTTDDIDTKEQIVQQALAYCNKNEVITKKEGIILFCDEIKKLGAKECE